VDTICPRRASANKKRPFPISLARLQSGLVQHCMTDKECRALSQSRDCDLCEVNCWHSLQRQGQKWFCKLRIVHLVMTTLRQNLLAIVRIFFAAAIAAFLFFVQPVPFLEYPGVVYRAQRRAHALYLRFAIPCEPPIRTGGTDKPARPLCDCSPEILMAAIAFYNGCTVFLLRCIVVAVGFLGAARASVYSAASYSLSFCLDLLSPIFLLMHADTRGTSLHIWAEKPFLENLLGVFQFRIGNRSGRALFDPSAHLI
jgi:hypothetical protein